MRSITIRRLDFSILNASIPARIHPIDPVSYTHLDVYKRQTVAGITTQYLVDENNPTGYAQVVEELRGGTVQQRYSYGHDLISQTMVGAGVTSFYSYDGLGSVRALTNSAGSVTDRYAYDAFGTDIATSGAGTPNAYRFTGEQQDAALGMYYLRARYYQPGSGRFWMRDTWGLDQQHPREWNRYVYVAADPVNGVDPSGNCAFCERVKLHRYTDGATRILYRVTGAKIFADQAGGAYAWTAKGLVDGLRSSLLTRLPLEAVDKIMSRVTYGISMINGKLYVAVNGEAPQEAVDYLTKRGYPNILQEAGVHAEMALYNQAVKVAAEHNTDIFRVVQAIGISNTEGPCPHVCGPFFQSIGVPLYHWSQLFTRLN